MADMGEFWVFGYGSLMWRPGFEHAEQMRAKFAERKAKINAAVEKAVADGTVTKDEAKEVRKAGGGHGHKGKKGKPALAGDFPHASPNAVPGESWGPRFLS